MTKAKSNFCKTLVALIIGLALAITAFGGFGLINARAAGEEEGGDTPKEMYLKVNDTVVTDTYGTLAENKFALKRTSGKNDNFLTVYTLVIDSELASIDLRFNYGGTDLYQLYGDNNSNPLNHAYVDGNDSRGDLSISAKATGGADPLTLSFEGQKTGLGYYKLSTGHDFNAGPIGDAGKYIIRINVISRAKDLNDKSLENIDIFDSVSQRYIWFCDCCTERIKIYYNQVNGNNT